MKKEYDPDKVEVRAYGMKFTTKGVFPLKSCVDCKHFLNHECRCKLTMKWVKSFGEAEECEEFKRKKGK